MEFADTVVLNTETDTATDQQGRFEIALFKGNYTVATSPIGCATRANSVA
jgi:hypothetical protein